MAVGQRMKGRVALVTGAANGIGKAISLRLAEEGAAVGCLDLDGPGAQRTARQLGPDSFAAQVDITDEDQVRDTVRALTASRPLDVLINNAGVNGPERNAEYTSSAGWDHTQAVNLRGAFLMAKYTLPHLIRRRGCMVNTSSALAFVGWPNDCAYGPTKAGMVQLTKGLSLDYWPRVRVNCVCPGAVHTSMTASLLEGAPDLEQALADYGRIHPLRGRLAQPREIADAVLFLASDDASFITGAVLPVDGGFLANARERGTHG